MQARETFPGPSRRVEERSLGRGGAAAVGGGGGMDGRDAGVERDEAPGAQAEMETIEKALAVEYPRTNGGWTATVEPYCDFFLNQDLRRMLLTMLGAVCAVLLIACINVASLILSRASQRTREVAIRCALGAGRNLVVRQILLESLTLALLGAAAGIGLAPSWRSPARCWWRPA